MSTRDHLSIFTIFARPLDFPEVPYVVREFRVMPSGDIQAMAECRMADTLEMARRHVPAGLVCVKEPGDAMCPNAVESWV